MGVFEAHHESCLTQRPRCHDHGGWLEEEIEVLGLAIDTRVFVDSVGPGNDILDTDRIERIQRALVDFPLGLRDPEVPVRERLAFFRGESTRPPALQVWHQSHPWPSKR